ncbi:MAG: hypothetical protein J0H81_00330, partial [Sphingopyxis terrae]|nr:hypothetical protein [Sphingopyxis terrae]
MQTGRRWLTIALLAGGLAVALLCGASAVPSFANEQIEQEAKNPNLWPAPGRDNQLTRHSTLKDINTENVKKLQFTWSQSTGALRGHEGQ